MTTSPKLPAIIAWWQIACGILGLLGYIISAVDWPTGARHMLLYVTGPMNIVFGLLFFCGCIFWGVRLRRGYHDGFLMSAILQAMQILSFAFLHGPHVDIKSGLEVSLRIAANAVNFNIGFQSHFFLGTRVLGVPWEVTVNLLAAFWTYLLVQLMPPRVFTDDQALASPAP